MNKWGCANLQVNEFGFNWEHEKQTGSVRWGDVRAIRAFKRDVFAYDLICVAFEFIDDTYVEIHEQMGGFIRVVEAIEKRFSGIDADWYRKIMLPVFKPTETLLWPPGG